MTVKSRYNLPDTLLINEKIYAFHLLFVGNIIIFGDYTCNIAYHES